MIVLDCCAAVEMVRGTEEGNALRALMLEGEEVISSDFFHAEIVSVFRKYVLAGKMNKSEGLACVADAVGLVETFAPLRENYIEAFHESLRLKHSVYDMLYFTLARRNAATLVTLDTKLLQLCEEQGVDCIHQIGL